MGQRADGPRTPLALELLRQIKNNSQNEFLRSALKLRNSTLQMLRWPRRSGQGEGGACLSQERAGFNDSPRVANLEQQARLMPAFARFTQMRRRDQEGNRERESDVLELLRQIKNN